MDALRVTIGTDAAGQDVTVDLARLPHLLIAGTTGSGKTTLIHSILTELLAQHGPGALRLLLIDPKRVELRAYRGLPHLRGPIVHDVQDAADALELAVLTMEERFETLDRADCRDIAAYNAAGGHLPRIVVVIDELANLILTDRAAIERPLVQLAAMGRAAGIHLVVATQHPAREVLTPLVRANIPARAALATVTAVDSRVMLGVKGAEMLPGHGAMLFRAGGRSLQQLQGRYVSDADIERTVSAYPKVREPGPPPPQQAMSPTVADQPYSVPGWLWRAVALVGLFSVLMVVGLGLTAATAVTGLAWWMFR